jgi:hypothetical protein
MAPLCDAQPEPLNDLVILPLDRMAARAARQKALHDKMPDVLAASRRLGAALQLHDTDRGPIQLTSSAPPRLNIDQVRMNGVRPRASSRMCENSAVDMNRTSENKEFLGRSMLPESRPSANTFTKPKTDEEDNDVEDHSKRHEVEDTADTMTTDVESGAPTNKTALVNDDGNRRGYW